MEITITNSTISGLHVTKKSSHPYIKLNVIPDPSRLHYDENCMKVVCPALQYIPSDIHNEVVRPKNPKSRRYVDILVKDVAERHTTQVPRPTLDHHHDPPVLRLCAHHVGGRGPLSTPLIKKAESLGIEGNILALISVPDQSSATSQDGEHVVPKEMGALRCPAGLGARTPTLHHAC